MYTEMRTSSKSLESCGPPVGYSWPALTNTVFTVNKMNFAAFMQILRYNLYQLMGCSQLYVHTQPP